MESVAKKILASAMRMAPGRFEVRIATRETHPHIAWRDYERARGELERLGFRWLADVQPVSHPEDPGAMRPNVLRFLLDEDGTTTAAFYRLALRWTIGGIFGRLLGAGRGVLDLVTEFTDGTSVETSNAPLSGKWSDPPFLVREFVRGSPAELLAYHRHRVAEHAARSPGAVPARMASLDDVAARADVTERRKREFRRSIGWITRAELAAHGASGAQLDQLEAAIRRLVAAQEAAAPAPPAAPPSAPASAPPEDTPPAEGPDPARIKAQSEQTITAAGGRVNPWLPPLDVGQPRSVDEVVGRALVMNALVNVYFNAPIPVIRQWIEANGVEPHLTPRERALLAKTNAELGQQEKLDLSWSMEALWALLWAGSLADDLAWDRRLPNHMASLLPNLKLNEDGSTLGRRMRLRPHAELLAMLDLYYRLHWYAEDGRLNGYPTPGVDGSVVMERRKALEWVLDPETGWDEVDLST